MKTHPLNSLTFVTTLLFAVSIGCSPTKPIYLNEGQGLSHYLDQATAVEYPDADITSLDEVTQSHPPMTVIDPEFTSFEDWTLEDAVSYALLNSKVMRGYGTPGLLGTRVSPGQDNLTVNPFAAATTFDVAIRESEAGFIAQPGAISSPSAIVTNTALDGNQGVEAALADFDTQYTSSFNLATSDEPRNGTSILNNEVFRQTQFTWQNEFAKKSANGTQLFFRNQNQYTENNNPLAPVGIQDLDSFYRASLEAEIRQPLLRGRGAFIQRMPIVISRISTDQEIANFEATVHNVVTNVEIRYWDLYSAFRNFEAAKKGRDAALETYRIIQDQFNEGAEVNIQNVAQAAGQYHFFQRQLYTAYNDLLQAEGQLRFLCGLASTDSRFVRPIDEPVTTPIEFDWCTTMSEALTYRPIVRRQRWEIKKRELGLQYAMNGLLPELNLNFVYRWLGLGNKFGVSGESQPFTDVNSGAWNELLGGNFQELAVGATFGMPIGFRREHANVRNAELKLAREIARAEDLELDVNRELTEVIRALAANQAIMQQAFNEWIRTVQEVEHFDRLEDAGVESLDVALDSQRRRAQTEVAFYTALAEYNKSIALLHRRKGTILAYSGVQMGEGPWPGKAYIDAEEHARRRSASRQINYGWTRPQVISRGGNLTPADNTGFIAPASQLPATPNDGNNMMDGQMMDGQMMDLPVEQSGTMRGPVEQIPYSLPVLAEPTPATRSVPDLNGATSQSQMPANSIQQVNYEATVTDRRQTMTAVPTKVQPVAIRITDVSHGKTGSKERGPREVQALRPERDASQVPGRRLPRLRAKPDTSSTASPAVERQPAESPSASQTSQAVLRTGNVQWERLGMSRPQPQTANTTARIKIK